ncbi:hypothetical protein [Macrococcus animalis]|uniref:hypothetical protein n=1 Tax=Macrococcus animalis TaxID=3395467 RepID=UPI0039BDF95B
MNKPIEENLSRLNHQVEMFLAQINTLLSLFEEVNKKAIIFDTLDGNEKMTANIQK